MSRKGADEFWVSSAILALSFENVLEVAGNTCIPHLWLAYEHSVLAMDEMVARY
jgi:hypothetical protein